MEEHGDKRSTSDGYGGVKRSTTPRIECLRGIGLIDASVRHTIFMELTKARIKRKVTEINEQLRATNNDWNHVLTSLLFKVMGGFSNRKAMIHLSETISYTHIARERGSVVNLEALLIGGAGLLEVYPEDDYIAKLKLEATHQIAKYGIKPMDVSEWHLNTKYPNNNPILRLVQIAATLYNNIITISSVTSCRSRKDIYKLFSCDTSKYWAEKISHELAGTTLSRHIGRSKCDIIGINLVVPIIYAYRNYTSSGQFNVPPSQLLMDIPAENNIYTKLWQSYAHISNSALDSQALIQLSREYCEKGACDLCPLAKYTLQ